MFNTLVTTKLLALLGNKHAQLELSKKVGQLLRLSGIHADQSRIEWSNGHRILARVQRFHARRLRRKAYRLGEVIRLANPTFPRAPA